MYTHQYAADALKNRSFFLFYDREGQRYEASYDDKFNTWVIAHLIADEIIRN